MTNKRVSSLVTREDLTIYQSQMWQDSEMLRVLGRDLMPVGHHWKGRFLRHLLVLDP
jgi:hypothetical protein